MAYIKTEWKDFPDETTPITSANLQKIEDALAGMLDYFYPVGTIYETTSTDLDTTTKMGNHFGGTWEVYGAGRVPVGVDTSQTEFNAIGKTGGAKMHTLTVEQIPNHRHGAYYNTNDGQQAIGVLVAKSNAGISRQNDNWRFNTMYEGGGQPHNNLQPYIVVYRYRRTA